MRAIGRKAYAIQEMKRLLPGSTTFHDEHFIQRAHRIITRYNKRVVAK